jgi:CRISPR-associated endoribonuclease Cas6
MTNEFALSSVVLTLRPLHAAAAVPHLGRAAHALLLDAVHRFDPALAETIHSGSDLRPFTASDLIGYSRKNGLQPESTCALRLTTLTAAVTQALLASIEDKELLGVGAEIRLGEIVLRVEAIDTGNAPSQEAAADNRHHPWAASTNYEELSAPWLLGKRQPDRHAALQFASPTTFKSGGRHVPVPLPQWVFGSLLEKWNAFAPIAFPPEVRRYAEECLVLSAFQLKSYPVRIKEGGLRVGAVGIGRYATTNFDRYWMSLIQLLADFAIFAGVGAGAGMGLGQCRRAKDAR